MSDTFSDVIVGDGVATPFMSFEDWKELMLRQAGQDPQELRLRKPSEKKSKDRSPPELGDSGLGEEGEISLSFNNYPHEDEGGPDTYVDAVSRDANKLNQDESLVFLDGKATVHRSNDAGKTCKERFSYSSFDAGATILKAGPEAKNAKAILVENKDSYMLLECMAQHKFIIVELSDDILIDTVVIANFEFFSSMIRHFRVSISDRYPVKSGKWLDLGIFEARNSRDIQPFLVQNPQIWAKYVRIEFLSHYGTEYYCPVSLLRIHGSRMLDSWKDSETGHEEEIPRDEEDSLASSHHSRMTVAEDPTELQEVERTLSELVNTSQLWPDPFDGDLVYQLTATCPASLIPLGETWSSGPRPGQLKEGNMSRRGSLLPERPDGNITVASHGSSRPNTAQIREASMISPSKQHLDTAISSPDSRQAAPAKLSDLSGGSSGGLTTNTSTIASKAKPLIDIGGKGRNSWTTTATAASPTVQEGFFNAITKRLQQVESNLTLSLKYVEDQSRHMQDVLQRAEQKQLLKLTGFHSDLSQTVLAELRNVRDQYVQIWQSTVLALESQRDQLEHDTVALSVRLNLLADEVVFQKRMAIVQAVLLLSCLFLVIFSRGVPVPLFAPLKEQPGAAPYAATALSLGQHSQRLCQPTTAAQQAEGYLATTSKAVDYSTHNTHSPDPHMTLALPRTHDIDDAASSPENQHLSPFAASDLQVDVMNSHLLISGRDAQVSSLCCPSSLQHNHSRKPLPSLPEHFAPTAHGT